MPPHGRYGETRGVRWDPELRAFTLKCDDCAANGKTAYWPLTVDEVTGQPEYWNPRTMQRCRACDADQRRRKERERTRNNPELREARRIAAKQYYCENKDVISMKHSEYMRGYRRRMKDKTDKETAA